MAEIEDGVDLTHVLGASDQIETLFYVINLIKHSPEISEFDRENVGAIISGEGDWFSAHLLRLIHASDVENQARLGALYPHHLAAYMAWDARRNSDYGPKRFALEGKTVRLGGLFSDPDRGLVIDGKIAYVEGYWDQLAGKSFIESALEGDVDAVRATRRFAAIEQHPELFQVHEHDRMVYIKIDHGPDKPTLGHIVSEKEFGNLDTVEVIE